MGLMDYLKTQFLEIIQWQDDSRDTLSFRFPDMDKEIKRGAQLIVRESQVAQFIYLGEFGDTFGPGKHALVTENIPVLTTLGSWKYGFESPFKADVYFVVMRIFTGNKWGTSNPVMKAKYGLEMTSFIVENVSVPPEVEQALDKRSSMSAVGNLNDYVKFQMAQGMEKGGSGAGGMATEMAVGMAMAQQMMRSNGG